MNKEKQIEKLLNIVQKLKTELEIYKEDDSMTPSSFEREVR